MRIFKSKVGRVLLLGIGVLILIGLFGHRTPAGSSSLSRDMSYSFIVF